MKAYKPLQDAFKALDQSTVQWYKSARFPKSMETANAILYRDLPVDASTLAYLAHSLGLSNDQIIDVLDTYAKENPKKALEVSVLKKLIAPVSLTKTEQEVIDALRRLPDEKRVPIYALVGAL